MLIQLIPFLVEKHKVSHDIFYKSDASRRRWGRPTRGRRCGGDGVAYWRELLSPVTDTGVMRSAPPRTAQSCSELLRAAAGGGARAALCSSPGTDPPPFSPFSPFSHFILHKSATNPDIASHIFSFLNHCVYSSGSISLPMCLAMQVNKSMN